MIGTLIELNFIVVIASFIDAVILIPVLWNKKSYIPRITSILTALSVYLFSFIFFDEGLIFGGLAELLCAVLWSFIAIVRG